MKNYIKLKLWSFLLRIGYIIRTPALIKLLKNIGLMNIVYFRGIFNPNALRKKFNFKMPTRLVKVHGVSGEILDVDINDLVGYNLYVNGEMNPEILAACSFLRESDKDIFMDVGANVGTTCVGASIATKSRLICIEASKKNISLLNHNIHMNGVEAWVLNCAVTDKISSENSFANLYLAPGNNGATSLSASYSKPYSSTPTEIERTPLSTIDKCIDFCGVSASAIYLVKMDIEEAELPALKGAKSIYGKVPLLVEYVAKSEKAKALLEYLSNAYSIFAFNSHLELIDYNPSRNYSSLLCLPLENLDMYLSRYKEKLSSSKNLLSSLPSYGLKRLDVNHSLDRTA